MRITHPVAAYQGFQPEDVFFVSNDQMIQLGTGYIIRFEQYEMYPQRPIHFYIQIDAQPAARSLLFGALLARAEQLRALTPGQPARLYASLAPGDEEMLQFYQASGLRTDDAEDMMRFPLPPGTQRAPMGMQFGSVPLADAASQAAFLQRINATRIQPFDQDYLTLWQQQQHFLALGYYRGTLPVCELLVTGAGESATLLTVYTRADYRRQGLASQLIGAAASVLGERGVLQMYAHIFRRNAPQVNMMQKLGARFVRTVTSLPGIDLQ